MRSERPTNAKSKSTSRGPTRPQVHVRACRWYQVRTGKVCVQVYSAVPHHASPAVHSASKQNMCAASYTGHKPASDSRSISSQELHALVSSQLPVHTCMCKRRGLDRNAKSRQTMDMPSSTAPFSLDSAVILAFSISTDGPSSHEAFRRPPRVSPASSFRSTQSEGFVDNLPWLAGAEPFER